ncbi:agmatine deiminase family protein [Armatimonas sp.]|uniref:agmatine deiminase family protein n=1 Tax=Armatimonas sp. TaxID=1872638 RepID=UPI00286BAEA9|nr:agmatine deiminase family protein [Armatimonas sp.]
MTITQTMTRRQLLQITSILTGASLVGCGGGGPEDSASPTPTPAPTPGPVALWRMPDESEPHQRTWMAFGASEVVWGATLLPEVQRNLALIARTISKYEPVTMLVRESEVATAQALLTGSSVELVTAPLDDLWMRDTGATFVLNKNNTSQKAGIKLNFNGWGNKQAFSQDANVAAFITQQASASLLTTTLVLEGGCIEVDGTGTAIITESCVLNDNRNPSISKADFEAKLKPLLGLEKIIWLPGIKGKDITDGHTDFYARFARPGVVLAGYDSDNASYDHAVTKSHLDILRSATDAQGRVLEVIALQAPTKYRKTFESKSFAAGYIGFYVCNGAVIAQEFGDTEADATTKDALQRAYPGRIIEQLNVDGIAAGGGSIHCSTQQEPKP